MTEVQGGQVDEVGNQEKLRPNMETVDEEHYPCKLEKVIQYEMTSYTCSGIGVIAIRGEEGPDVSGLREKEDSPGANSVSEGFGLRFGRTSRWS